jgi:CRP-like cAMP-binding protein
MDTDYNLILNRILNSYSTISKSAVDLVYQNGIIEVVRKNEVVFSEKRFNAFEYFQLSGISHRYNIDSDGQNITTGIYQNETVITPHFTRTSNNQSIFSLQALTDCFYLNVPAGTFRELSGQNQQIRLFGRAVIEKEYIRTLNFEVLFRSYNATDRLLFFRTHFPMLENIIPHTIIASFLGITPVSFSRLRNGLAKK